jgi:formamidase
MIGMRLDDARRYGAHADLGHELHAHARRRVRVLQVVDELRQMGATAVVRFKLHEGEAARHNIRWPRFAHPGYFNAPEWAAPRNFIATMGMPIRDDGTQEGEDLTLAARNALINMIELLQERGWTREQAYIICSVAVDLKVSNIVDLPNVTVSAFLPEDIFG